MKRLLIAALAAQTLAFAAPALAADGVTTGGGASITGNVATLVANTSTPSATDDFSTLSFALPAGLTFGGITQLAAEFNVTDDDCVAGSPRFQIQLGGPNVFVAFGPPGTLTGCPQNTWVDTGNLTAAQASECRVDTSKFAGGTQCDSWAHAVAILGTQAVQSITLVVDASWTGSANPAVADKEQTVLIRNVRINGTAFLVPGAGAPGAKPKVNPAKLCRAQMAALGSRAAFNELWSVNATSNGFGKCVSAVAHARNAGKAQAQIMAAIESCKARGLKGAALGACVAATDSVAATRTEAQERKTKKPKR